MEENTMKIQASDLRIGNFLDRSGLMEVVGIKIHAIKIYDHYNKIANPTWFQPEGFKGIPLTPEWLERFGFKKGESVSSWTHLRTSNLPAFDEPIREWFTVYDDLTHGKQVIYDRASIKYVHQLQNLYFALTGQELTLKP